MTTDPHTLIPHPERKSSLPCQGRYGQCSHRPPEPWPADAERWARFCAEIDDRIKAERRREPA